MNIDFNKYDKYNMLNIIENFHEQITESFDIVDTMDSISSSNINVNNIKNIIFCGMGGSSIGSAFVKNLIEDDINIPMFINNDYTLPKWVDENTLVVITSYSGDTEETISNYKKAIKQNASLCIITSGGYLLDQAKINNIPFCLIPLGYPPRTAFGFMSSIIILILNKFNIVKDSLIKDLNEVPKTLVKCRDNYLRKDNSKALKLAESLYQKNPIIYSSPLTKSIGYRFKCQLSENSKVLSYYHSLPELNHNDVEGYLNLKNSYDDYSIIWLQDKEDDLRITQNIKRTSNALSFIKSQDFVSFKDVSFLGRQYHMLYFLDIVSFYLSYLYKIDPTPIKIINKIKS